MSYLKDFTPTWLLRFPMNLKGNNVNYAMTYWINVVVNGTSGASDDIEGML